MKKVFTLLAAFCFFMSFSQEKKAEGKSVSHTFYAIGNTGYKGSNAALDGLGNALKGAGKNSTVLFLGNAASPDGFDAKNKKAIASLNQQAAIVNGFAGNVVFIPGADDWANGPKGLKEQQEFIDKALKNDEAFQPKKGCALEKIKINDDVDLLVLDSQWALADWDDYPEINDKCDIKSKEAFYTEIEHEIVKSEGKTILIALYHPIATYGKYGSSYAFGIDPQQLNNKYYQELSDRLLTIARRFEKVVFVSGHEHNMQYIVEKEVPVIISGSGKTGRHAGKGPYSNFSSAEAGFAKITAYSNGTLTLAYYSESNGFAVPIYETEVFHAEENKPLPDYNEYQTPQYVYKSIYTPKELHHSALYKMFWGQHYRKDYTTEVQLKTALLDTLYGGLKPLRKGGGHQTSSLRLVDDKGREYTLRTAKKSALRFLQHFLFKTQYLTEDIADTYFLELVQDYWTTANPYGSLTIAGLSDAIEIYHPNPRLYYIPKQKALGIYNDEFGDDMYFIEEQANDGHGKTASFGFHDKIIGTDELLEKLDRKDEVKINEQLYIRSRLFDNIIGDFDRHHDQWRWTEEIKKDSILFYSPVPRDRDQAYSDFDGFMLGAITTLNPPLRFMQRYNSKYKSVRWFNDAGDDVDRVVLKNDTEEDWVREAKYIREHLTEADVSKAFGKYPEGLDKKKEARIKKALLGRIAGVEENARRLYRYLKSYVTITGTEKDDWFIITRQPDGITNVKAYRIKDGVKGTLFWDVDYNSAITKEIWIYGLADADVFEAVGDGNNPVRIKIIGGQDNDVYRLANNSNIRVFDQKSEPNTFEAPVHKTLVDDYDLKTYDFMKGRRDVSQIMPLVGYNPDDGVGVGAGYSYTKNALRRNPFTAQHSIKAMYYTATNGINISYAGEFAHIFNNVNLGIKTGYTSPYYTNNFFGLGNDTKNYDKDFEKDYNRVRIRTAYFSPSLIYRGYYGSTLSLGVQYENIEVEKTTGRFISEVPVSPKVFDGQGFYGAEASYAYTNFDNTAMPRKGVGFSLTGGFKANTAEPKNYAYIIPELRVTTKIDPRGILVYATKIRAYHIFSNEFEFYQATTLGDGEGLRGYRKQRFSGRTSYYQSSDIRLALGKLSNGFLPIAFGIYGGFDYGRVWVANEHSTTWHTSHGGGLFFNLAGLTTANIAYFNSRDGGRLNIGLQLAF
jgi:hypothetical protein